jgi:hypothetical protein
MSNPEDPKERAPLAIELAGGGGVLLREAVVPPRPLVFNVRSAPQLCPGSAAP